MQTVLVLWVFSSKHFSLTPERNLKSFIHHCFSWRDASPSNEREFITRLWTRCEINLTNNASRYEVFMCKSIVWFIFYVGANRRLCVRVWRQAMSKLPYTRPHNPLPPAPCRSANISRRCGTLRVKRAGPLNSDDVSEIAFLVLCAFILRNISLVREPMTTLNHTSLADSVLNLTQR